MVRLVTNFIGGVRPWWLVAAGFAGYVLLFGSYTSMTYLAFHTNTFDLGIFTQIFDSMTQHGTQNTTIERNRALPHFAIHISPALYLLAPLYWLFPTPLTLLLSQTVLLASGAFPLYRLASTMLNDEWAGSFFALAYLFSFGIHGANLYDFHEISLAAPFLLWAFYYIESNNNKRLLTLLLLASLMVKEEIPVAVFFVGVYILAVKKRHAQGALVAGLSLLYYWFVSAVAFPYFGGSPMYDRYANLLPNGGGGGVELIQAVLHNPSALWCDLLSNSKLVFLTGFLLCFAFLPLFSIGGLILLVPVLILNVLSSYAYQYMFAMHYAVVSTCLLFYGVLLSVRKFHHKFYRVLSCLVLATSVFIGPQLMGHEKFFLMAREMNNSRPIDEALRMIPEADSVWISNRLGSHSSGRNSAYLFPEPLGDIDHTTWVAVDLRDEDKSRWPAAKEDYYKQIRLLLNDNQYGVYAYLPGVYLLFRRDYPAEANPTVLTDITRLERRE